MHTATLELAMRDGVEQAASATGLLTIKEVAQLSGLSTYTLRYYERAELMLDVVGRVGTNHNRGYSQRDLSWISFLQRLRATDMPIREIHRYVELVREGEQTIQQRVELLKNHRGRVEQQLQEIEQNLAALITKINHYEEVQAQLHVDGAGFEAP